MNPSAVRRIFPSVSLIGALLFFVVLWLSDFPKPIYDDLFYLGASLNLANGGDLSNPLLARQEFPSHFFFVYPPLHSYAVAGWLKMFGISAASVTAFPALMYFIITAATIAILRKHRAPAWLEWLVPLGVAVAFLPAGLRSEPLAVALTMAGFALLECGGAPMVFVFTGFLALFMGASASPRIAPFSATLALLYGYRLWKGELSAMARWKFVAAASTAMALAGLSFLAMIHFRLREFLMMFHLHAGRVSEGKLVMIHNFIKEQRATVWPLWALFFVLLIVALRRSKHALNRLGFLIALMLPVQAVIADLVLHVIWFMILPVLFFAAACLQDGSSEASRAPRSFRNKTIIIALGLFATFGLANLKILVNVIGIQTGRISAELGEQRERALDLRPSAGHPLLVDSWSARYLYDYRVPPGCFDLGFCTPYPGAFVTTADLRPGDIYLVTFANFRGIERDTYVPKQPDILWNPLHISLLSSDRYPRRIFIVTAEDCKGLRPGVLKVWP